MSNMGCRKNTSTTSQSLFFVMEIGTDRLSLQMLPCFALVTEMSLKKYIFTTKLTAVKSL
jgi:hypothetical protein